MVSTHGRDEYTQDRDEGAQGSGNEVQGRMERVTVKARHQGMWKFHRGKKNLCVLMPMVSGPAAEYEEKEEGKGTLSIGEGGTSCKILTAAG